MDALIEVTIKLLILSLITEKITGFIKLQAKTLSQKSIHSEIEKQREKLLLGLSIVVGVVVAASSNVNVLTLDTFPMGHAALNSTILYQGVGYILTGVFLSLGSKFFHDLLDVLLQVKNLKRRLNDEKTYDVESVKELMDHLELSDGRVVRSVLEENRMRLKAIENVMGVGVGATAGGTQCVEVYISDDRSDLIPPKLYLSLPEGRAKEVPIHVITNAKAEILAFKPSDRLAHEDTTNNAYGAFGCVVTKKGSERWLVLTCYHVLKTVAHKYEAFQKRDEEPVVVQQDGKPMIGEMIEAVRDVEIDAALVEPYGGIAVSTAIPKIGVPLGERAVSEKDVDVTRVRIFGSVSGKVRIGIIKGIYNDIVIDYREGPDKEWELFNLISIASTSSGKAFSRRGDSGSLVVDEQGYALGIIVAGNQSRSFAIPLRAIFNRLNLTLAMEATS